MAILAAFGRGGAVLALILLVVALLKQLIVLVGFLLALIKFAIVVAFVLMMVMIVLAIVRDRSRRKREAERRLIQLASLALILRRPLNISISAVPSARLFPRLPSPASCDRVSRSSSIQDGSR